MRMTTRWRRAAGIALAALVLDLATLSPPVSAKAGVPLTTTVFADLAEKHGPAVVNIDTLSRRRVRVMPLFGVPESRIQEARGLGSGFIVDANGLILTNNHVIQGANEVMVTLDDGRKFPAKLVGRDPALDLAVIDINAKGLPTLTFANDDSVRVGDWVMAMGSPLGLDKTVTKGIVSALNRSIALNESVQFIQTDAPINPGNSGGPLLNLSGQVIGVNTAVAAQAQGIGFAIPAGVARHALEDLRKYGRIRRAWLGLGLQEVTPERAEQAGLHPGLVIMEIYAGTGAAKVGLQEGDVLLKLDGTATPNIGALRRIITRKEPGQSVSATILRKGRQQTLTIPLSDMPSEPTPQ
jgi:S1-C subfamily serine protease